MIRHHLAVVLAASSNQVTGDIAAGVALLVAGGLLITGGLILLSGLGRSGACTRSRSGMLPVRVIMQILQD